MDGVGTTRYTYTAAGQLLTEDGPFASDTVSNIYSNRLRVGLALQQPSGQWTNTFGYDTAKRLSSVASPVGTFTYQYPSGSGTYEASRITFPSGAYITNNYDSVARLTSTSLKNSGGTVLDSYAYTYNAASQRTGLTRADSSTVGYSYDPIGQLTVANDNSTGYSWPGNRSYAYDAAGNLNWRTNAWGNGFLEQFTVDNRNQLSSNWWTFSNEWGGETQQYDANGNLVERDSGGDVMFQYTYDDENRLTFLEYDDYGTPYYQLNQLVYDGLGRLRQAGEYIYDGTEWQLTDAKNYIYDGWRVIQERDGSNNPLASYTRGNDLSGSMEGAGGIGGILAWSSGFSGSSWATNDCYFADANGNIAYMIDGSQAMVASYRYDAFGFELRESGTHAYNNSYRFSSKELFAKALLDEGALYYYGYRFYDPELQRWLNRDPLGELAGLNLYGYVSNDPLARFDPFGEADAPKDQPPATSPPVFGGKPFQTGTDNCLCYGLDRPGGALQPDGGDGRNNEKNCPGLMKQIKATYKGVGDVPKDGNCPTGSHKIAVFSDGNGGYHVQRQDSDGGWSEMSLRPTYSPRKCKKGGNSPGKSCGDLCAPDQPK